MRFLLSSIALLMGLASVAQNHTLEGTVIDALTKEALIGAYVKAGTAQIATDFDGHFEVELPAGTYTVEVTYIGYKTVSRTVNLSASTRPLSVALETESMSEAEVVADVARERETPVAFTNVLPAQIQEELGSQDLPMILNSTPGVYATQQGGGDGDARVTIRGFSQRNVAVMIDGVPVNDMENGWVYWSNWFGLDAVTQSIQVQRGLGASKIAIPSVGGTMNIITKGINNRAGFMFKQELGSFGFNRISLGYNSGRLDGGWGVSAAGSFKRSEGFVNQNFSAGNFYYIKLEKELGDHILSASAFGAPQSHGQRSFKNRASVFNRDYATEIGYSTEELGNFPEYGLDYNEFVGTYQERFYTYAVGGDTLYDVGSNEKLNTAQNYYHKPQFTLRDFWRISDKLYMSNIGYVSIGNGGGTAMDWRNSQPQPLADGTMDLQFAWDSNRLFEFGPDGLNIDENGEYEAQNIVRSSINNHFWYGYLGTLTYAHDDNWKISGGLDARRYTGEHYRTAYNLIGGDYYVPENKDQNANDKPNTPIGVGGTYAYHDEGHVAWLGSFVQAEYASELWSAFVNISGARSGYKAVDHFRERTLEVNGQTYEIGYLDQVEVDGVTYDRNSEGLSTYETDWVKLGGYTLKTGVNYNINEFFNTFVNLGYLNRAPRFNSVITTQNNVSEDYENELVRAGEYGLSYADKRFASNINTYFTRWENRPVNRFVPITTVGPGDVEEAGVFVTDMDALHMGVEWDFAWKLHRKWTLEGVFSLGDWTWQSKEIEPLIDNANGAEIIDVETGLPYMVEFDPRGVHVGDAAQTQVGGSLRFAPSKRAYVKARFTYFDRNWSQFNPESSVGDDAGRDPWQIPAYGLVDIHAGFNFELEGMRVQARLSVFNALDAVYVSDAQNNDTFLPAPTSNWDAASASVFFGAPRRFNFSLTLNL